MGGDELYFACHTANMAVVCQFAREMKVKHLFDLPTRILQATEKWRTETKARRARNLRQCNESSKQIQTKKMCDDQKRPLLTQGFRIWKKLAYFLEFLVLFITIPAAQSTEIQIHFKQSLVFGSLRMAIYYVAICAFLTDALANHIDQTVSVLTGFPQQLPDNYPDSMFNRADPFRKYARLALLFFGFHEAYPTEFNFDHFYFAKIGLTITVQQMLVNIVKNILHSA